MTKAEVIEDALRQFDQAVADAERQHWTTWLTCKDPADFDIEFMQSAVEHNRALVAAQRTALRARLELVL
jgi:hypothetical protein